MARRGSRDLAIGATLALALVILALGIMAVGGESGLFFKRVPYKVVFAEADGLVVGAPVRMAGVGIGTVKSIILPVCQQRLNVIERIVLGESELS